MGYVMVMIAFNSNFRYFHRSEKVKDMKGAGERHLEVRIQFGLILNLVQNSKLGVEGCVGPRVSSQGRGLF